MPFKFESLEVWDLAPDYVDTMYDLAASPPRDERSNLTDEERLRAGYHAPERLVAKLHAFRRRLVPTRPWGLEESAIHDSSGS
jgi:hypothetical protein